LLSEIFDLCLPQFFLFLKKAQGITDNFACAAVSPAFDFLFYEVFKMGVYGIAGWHGETSYKINL
jgi:hypothetical protein